MLKKLSITLLIFPFILTGCLGTEDSQQELTTGKEIYQSNTYSIIYPTDWEVIDSSGFTSNVPNQTQIAFRNNIKSNIFTANLNISTTQITTGLSAEDFAKSNLKNAKNSLLDFQELNNINSIVFYGGNEHEAYTLEFSGRKSAVESVIHFKQLYTVRDNIGYIVTAAHLPDEDETIVKELDEMLNSFALE